MCTDSLYWFFSCKLDSLLQVKLTFKLKAVTRLREYTSDNLALALLTQAVQTLKD